MASFTFDFNGMASTDDLSAEPEWVQQVGSADGFESQGAGRIYSLNKGSVQICRYDTAFDTNDVSVEIKCDADTGGTGFRSIGPMVVTNTTDATGYYLRQANSPGSFENHNLEIVSGGTFQDGNNSGDLIVTDELVKITVTDIGGGQVDLVGYVNDLEVARLDAATAVGGSTWYPALYGSTSSSSIPSGDDWAAQDESAASGRIMGSLAGTGGLAGQGGIAGQGGGIAG